VTELLETAHLVWPTAAVERSYLAGERADCVARGQSPGWLGPASEDFEAFVCQRRGVRVRWGVPSTLFWYISDEEYIGTLVIRHRLTRELAEAGGHVGYHVVTPRRRQGHATRMLQQGRVECGKLGLDRVLLTCDPENLYSVRVILANGGLSAGHKGGQDHFWITINAAGTS
jgi:predicted acetyltransferase